MDSREIENLLEKYWQCETKPAEEEKLRIYFTQTKELPLYLRKYRELFVYQQEERRIRLSEDFDRKILNRIRQQQASVVSWRRIGVGIAAVVLISIALRAFVVQQEQTVILTEQTPEQALTEVRQALSYVALKLNQGQKIVEKNMSEVKEITRFIKE